MRICGTRKNIKTVEKVVGDTGIEPVTPAV
jgi:hypothetical protein